MSKISKIAIYTLFFVFVFQIAFFWISFADWDEAPTPMICKATPNELQMYINFQVEMIWALSHAGKQEEKLFGYKNKWLFSYWVLKPGVNIVDSLKRFANKILKPWVDAARALELGVVMSEKMVESSFSDSLWSLSIILFKWEVYVRDRKKLQDIDNSLLDLTRDLIMDWLWSKDVDDAVLWELVELQRKYYTDSPNSMFSDLNMSSDLKYKNIIRKLMRVNNWMKSELWVFSSAEDIDVWNSDFNMKFNKEFLTRLMESYDESSKCNTSFQDFWKDISQLWHIKQSAEESWNMIADSSKKLAQAVSAGVKTVWNKLWAWGNNELELTSDQKDLLMTVYGINAAELTKEQWAWLKELFNPGKFWKNVWSRSMMNLSNLENAASNELINSTRQLWKQEKKEMLDWVKKIQDLCGVQWEWTQLLLLESVKSLVCYMKLDKLNDNMLNQYMWLLFWTGTVNSYTWLISNLNESIDVMLSDLNSDLNVVLQWDSSSTTTYFVQVGSYIHNTVEHTIWNKDENNSVVQMLWKVCEYQCGNKWWRCYY